jgi:uncharacterized protein YjbJ (UPF0337 family)
MALTAQTLEGNWNEIKGKLRERWGVLSDDELQQARGNVEQLVGTIQRKTGETREAVREYLDKLSAEGASAVRQTAEKIRRFSESTAESMQDAASQAADSMRASMYESRQVIRQHPLESVLTCFGAGVVTGVILGLLFRSR